MKKLITYSDGSKMPLWQEDLGFMYQIFSEILTEFVRAFAYGRGRFIITGCQKTYDQNNNTHVLTKGLIWYDGEVVYVPEQTLNGLSTDKCYIRKQELSGGLKQFQLPDGNTEAREVYDMEYGKLMAVGQYEALNSTELLPNSEVLVDTLKREILNDGTSGETPQG